MSNESSAANPFYPEIKAEIWSKDLLATRRSRRSVASEHDQAAASEKRIRRIVYCAEQLMGKRIKLWQSRYERACAAAESVEELDEAFQRVHAKFPHIGLDKIMDEAQRDAAA